MARFRDRMRARGKHELAAEVDGRIEAFRAMPYNVEAMPTPNQTTLRQRYAEQQRRLREHYWADRQPHGAAART